MKELASILYQNGFISKNIYKNIYIFLLSKMTHLFMPTNFKEMNKLSNSEFFFRHLRQQMANYLLWVFLKRSNLLLPWIFTGFYFKVLLTESPYPLIFFIFLKSIKLFSYYNYKNCGFAQFMTIYKFIFYKCKRSTELQKSAN